jgi:tetratricopeptide (TPR) repeat protein
LYAKALSLNNQGGSPDLTLRYLINLSSGVAYANSGDLRLAKKAYARASADADELYGSDHPELFKLLFSQSSLCAKKRDFDECVEFAQRAADILMLKAPERTGDIGLALLWAGRACNALRKYEVAAKILAEAKRHFDRTVPPPRQDHLEDLHLQIHIARTSGYVGSPF